MQIVEKTVVLPSGVALSYAERGDSTGVPLVLLHGYTDSWRSWIPVLAALPPSIRALAPSQRGHGDSAKPEHGYDMASFAADVAGLLDRLAIPRAAIAGHSMGSMVALRFAADRPERTLGLVLLGAFRSLRGNPEIVALWDEAVATVCDPVDPGFVRAFQESTLAQAVPPAFFAGVVAESLKVPARIWRAALRAQIDEDLGGVLPRIAAPALVLRGERDTIGTRDEHAALGALPGARRAIYEGAGHGLHWEEPTRAAADIAAFVAAIDTKAWSRAS